MKLKVGGFAFDFRVVDLLPNATGATRKPKGIMRVEAGMAHDQERETALHEVIHAVWDQTGLRNRDDDEEEQVISSLCPGLFAFLRENPRFVEYILDRG